MITFIENGAIATIQYKNPREVNSFRSFYIFIIFLGAASKRTAKDARLMYLEMIKDWCEKVYEWNWIECRGEGRYVKFQWNSSVEIGIGYYFVVEKFHSKTKFLESCSAVKKQP